MKCFLLLVLISGIAFAGVDYAYEKISDHEVKIIITTNTVSVEDDKTTLTRLKERKADLEAGKAAAIIEYDEEIAIIDAHIAATEALNITEPEPDPIPIEI